MLGYRKPMSPISNFCFFFLLLFFLSFSSSFLFALGDEANNYNNNDDEDEQQTIRFDLLHRHHPQVSEKLNGDMKIQDLHERMKDIHEHDRNRHRSISKSMNQKQIEDARLRAEAEAATQVEVAKSAILPPATSTPIGMKMISGADFGSSEYFVQLKVGTPAQTFMLIADTGSDLTWLKCRYRRCFGNCSGNVNHKSKNEKKQRFRHALLANQSSTFKTVSCSSTMCTNNLAELFAVAECDTPTSPCVYDYSYAGGASAKGIFAWETLTVGLTNGKEKQLRNSIIGCTEIVQGNVFDGADGVMGLGTSSYSLTYKAAENANGGGFSYCLVDHLTDQRAVSYFVLGVPTPSTSASTSSAKPPAKMSYTKLYVGDPYSSFYGVDLIGISADGQMLNIPPRVWDSYKGCGTIIDSGTSLTVLATPAFDVVMEVLTSRLKQFQQIEIEPFNFCFNNSQYTHDMAPKLRFHFGDGTVFEPPTKSYIVSVGEFISCIGIVSMPFPSLNIIGNILQQNHLWQFDFQKRRVGFAASECI
uniref:Peptidase A1 domain-containing protein n=2 Tax=Cucumis melo TaxID=3656 RepID=A0A9I9DKZ2_CUCME